MKQTDKEIKSRLLIIKHDFIKYSMLENLLGVFNLNYAEIDFLYNGDILEFDGIKKIAENIYKDEIDTEHYFYRGLLNFVAFAGTLIDHTRTFIKKIYAGTELESAYEEKLTYIFPKGINYFIKGLRNYLLHYELPYYEYQQNKFEVKSAQPFYYNLNPSKLKQNIYLCKAQLLKWDGWNKEAKKYINLLEEKIDLLKILKDYNVAVNLFYDWLLEEHNRLHENDLAEGIRLQNQLDSYRK